MPEEAETNEESTTDSSLAKEEIYNDKLTKKSDVYAYAMVVLEVRSYSTRSKLIVISGVSWNAHWIPVIGRKIL